VDDEQKAIAAAPIGLQVAGPPELKGLRANGTSKLNLVNFWATWCGPCIAEFPDLQTTYRMYRSRNLELVTVSVDVPDARPNVMKLLETRRASSANYIFATDDTVGLQEAFDPALPASVPFTMLIAPNGDVLHQVQGEAIPLELRRAILANLADDPNYPGIRKYWTN
jgi:thiol-disulfide isomerase/thioredoxin